MAPILPLVLGGAAIVAFLALRDSDKPGPAKAPPGGVPIERYVAARPILIRFVQGPGATRPYVQPKDYGLTGYETTPGWTTRDADALRSFQIMHNRENGRSFSGIAALPETGLIDDATWIALQRYASPLPSPSPSPSPSPTPIVPPSLPSGPVVPPTVPPVVPPTVPPAPSIPPVPGLDPGIPLDVAEAVTKAMLYENDAAKLEAFAATLTAYPMAAALLRAKATSIRLGGQSPVPPILPGPLPTPMAAKYPIGGPETRSGRNALRPTGKAPFVVIRGPGDAGGPDSVYPVRLAEIATGSAGNYKTLGVLNPHVLNSDGSAKDSLRPGDAINVPWTWAKKLALTGGGPSGQAPYRIEQDAGAPVPLDA